MEMASGCILLIWNIKVQFSASVCRLSSDTSIGPRFDSVAGAGNGTESCVVQCDIHEFQIKQSVGSPLAHNQWNKKRFQMNLLSILPPNAGECGQHATHCCRKVIWTLCQKCWKQAKALRKDVQFYI